MRDLYVRECGVGDIEYFTLKTWTFFLSDGRTRKIFYELSVIKGHEGSENK